jgi:hypothetical protein
MAFLYFVLSDLSKDLDSFCVNETTGISSIVSGNIEVDTATTSRVLRSEASTKAKLLMTSLFLQ